MKKKKKHKYHPKKPAAPSPRPVAVSPLKQSAEVINRMKPIMEAAQRTKERLRERLHKKSQ